MELKYDYTQLGVIMAHWNDYKVVIIEALCTYEYVHSYMYVLDYRSPKQFQWEDWSSTVEEVYHTTLVVLLISFQTDAIANTVLHVFCVFT